MKETILEQLKSFEGEVSFYYKNLITGETLGFRQNIPLEAASVIKIPVLVEAFSRIEVGTLDKNGMISIKKEDKLPSCGALSYMHDGLMVTFEDLYTLMIILSDNTATNLLIKYLGMEQINSTLGKLGLKNTKINRLLFDSKQSALGVQNYISAYDIGSLFEKMYFGELISPESSLEMLRILKNQRLNGKIPFHIHGKMEVAHKTGEDDGITHDVGIVYAPQPFVVCFCGNQVEVPAFERLMQDITASLVQLQS
ncbi:class A beta-lactamase-related serine hydrolase [Anaerocolumna sp. AGMB13025]|uniref:serine hydrolase n=1 Tax=Anaerocolumna sp. AGMB13025 TaxID=3039116 RepID=UPI00241C6416|nr:serine hydrolase [Anaerocolumna sp. AGMB13025]WFR55968.1 class A beta-lactamase-related serine hydrolase [Anaerocolumna sp. AGMB13025]